MASGPRSLRAIAEAVGVPVSTLKYWRDNGAPIVVGRVHTPKMITGIRQWHETWLASKRTPPPNPSADLAKAKLAADLKYRLAKAQREQIRLAREQREYADLAFSLLAEWVTNWKRQIESWVHQVLLVVPEEQRPEAKRLFEVKVDQLFADMAEAIG